MSLSTYQLTEEQLWCCICLDVFTDPVTLPCGHNFCKSCIMEHLKSSPQRQCPMCKERVDKKQKLGVNTFISELAVQYRQSAGRRNSSSSQQLVGMAGKPDRPPAGLRHMSLKSSLLFAFSLMCLILLFAANLCFHQILSSLEVLSVFAPVNKLSEGMCTEHNQPLELYCQNDQVTICQSCRASRHKFHQVVPVKDVYEKKKVELRRTETRIQQVIRERRLKIQEMKHSVKLNQEAADQEMTEGVQIFSSMIQSLERAQAEHIGMIQEKQKVTEKQAQCFITELEMEVSKLTRRHVDVEQLSHSKEPLRLLQSFSDLNVVPPTKDWTQVRVCPVVYEGLTRTALVGAINQLTETVRNAMKNLQDAEMKNILQFSVDVTLDPDTAHPALVMSDDGKQVHCGDEPQKPSKNSKRSEPAPFVLGKQGFSCGKFHYGVQVKGKTSWTLGVVRESVKKKKMAEMELNPENGCWAIRLQNRQEYVALADGPVGLSVTSPPDKVRVFVNYDEGLVSFYDVDAAVLLHSFTGCSFTERIYPFFSPGSSDGGTNSDPLIITTDSSLKEN